ncbi:hypothetical protein BT69DRAFT_1292815 [Atractiella rhizophila]|nr:hypothetical protein BT69DRAFT_1292815 [Atractiella rhizophila]
MSVESDPFVASKGPNLQDILTIERRGNIFYDYLREFKDVVSRISDSTLLSTVIVPINHAIIALPRKPHQGPPSRSGTEDMPQIQKEEENKKYLEEWVKVHVIPGQVEDIEEKREYETLQGRNIEVRKDGEHWIVQGAKAVDTRTASNGKLILIDSTISVEE